MVQVWQLSVSAAHHRNSEDDQSIKNNKHSPTSSDAAVLTLDRSTTQPQGTQVVSSQTTASLTTAGMHMDQSSRWPHVCQLAMPDGCISQSHLQLGCDSTAPPWGIAETWAAATNQFQLHIDTPTGTNIIIIICSHSDKLHKHPHLFKRPAISDVQIIWKAKIKARSKGLRHLRVWP